jgi:DNA-binding GntR family transcriptional regulator
MALEKSVPLLTEADFAAAEDLIEAMDVERGIASWVDLNRRFHLALYVGAGPRLRAAIQSQYDAVDRYLRLELAAMDNAGESQNEHRAILRACRDRDAGRAVRLYHLHIAEAGADLAEALAQRQAAGG